MLAFKKKKVAKRTSLRKLMVLIAGIAAFAGTGAQAKEELVFGVYEQDGNTENGLEDITWEVLDQQDGKVLLLSKYILNNWRVHDAIPVGYTLTWKESDIRRKLNDSFFYTAFSDEEQALILDTNVATTDNEVWGTYGGESTTDKVFLLSLGELGKYYQVDPGDQDAWDANLKAEPTEYAVLNGISVTTEDQDVLEEGKSSIGCAAWWLRTPGMEFDGSRMANILWNGSVNANGGPVTDEGGVRPAIWVSSEVLKNQVQKVQAALNNNGFDCGTPDGMAGEKTKEVIRAYQEANGLEVTGEINAELMLQLGIIEVKETEQTLVEGMDTAEDENLILSELTFGSYEGYDTQWVVVDVDDTSALLLAKYVIEKRPYNDVRMETTWESSTMRTWLNGEYLNQAFSQEEQDCILTTHFYNNGDPETDDRVFLLSEAEAGELKELGDDVYLAGAEYNFDAEPEDGKTLHETKCGWGLRTPASDKNGVLFVSYTGEIKGIYVDGKDAVRPAIRMSLEDVKQCLAEQADTEETMEETNNSSVESVETKGIADWAAEAMSQAASEAMEQAISEAMEQADTEEGEKSDVSAVQDNSETAETDSQSGETVTMEQLAGNYVNVKTGMRWTIAADGNCELEYERNGYLFAPYQTYGSREIEGSQVFGKDSSSWNIIKTENGIHLENDTDTYIPEAEYRSFTYTTPYQIGDEVTSDNVSLMVSGCEINTSTISTGNIVQVSPTLVEDSYLYLADEGKCFVDVKFDIKNIGTNPFYVNDVIAVSLIYDNQYQFSSYETRGNMLTVNPNGCSYVLSSGASYGSTPMISALSSTTCIAHIMCPEEVMNSQDKSLYAVFQVEKADKSVETFVYDLKG